MDYEKLADELLCKMQSLHRAGPQRNIDESLRGEAMILHFISRRGCGVLPGEIGQEMGVSSARVAAALNSLEVKGLITRQIDKSDRRRILVSITPEGSALEARQFLEIVGEVARMLELLGERDAKEHVRIMGRLAEILMSK